MTINSAAGIMMNVQKEIYSGTIILQHCANEMEADLSNTVQTLPQIISSHKAQGYTFVTLPQLLGIDP